MFLRYLKMMLFPGGLILAGVMMVIPINSFVVRVGLLLGLGLTYGRVVTVRWVKRRAFRYGMLALPAAIGLLVVLPGGAIDTSRLRSAYVVALRSCEHRRYVWGGEGRLGLDCSGLARKAWRNALLDEYVHTLNGSLLRDVLEQWWYDAGARALGQGYRDYTVPIGEQGMIRTMDYADLRPGDLAVTDSGVHVLAFLGDEDWIQATIPPGRVIILDGRSGQSRWFDEPVTIHRWSLLCPRDTGPELEGARP